MKLPKYFKEGVFFQCQGSGKCCVSHGEYGYVYLSLADRKRMAQELGLTTRQFTLDYCQKVDGHWAIRDNPKGGDCIFLQERRCTVYEGRPTQCRTWPFWPEVMNARSWKKDVESFCPGVGKGRHYTAEEIQNILNEQLRNESEVVTEQRK